MGNVQQLTFSPDDLSVPLEIGGCRSNIVGSSYLDEMHFPSIDRQTNAGIMYVGCQSSYGMATT